MRPEAAGTLFFYGQQSPSHADIVLNVLVGSVFGAWFAAGHAVRLAGPKLNRLIFVLLTLLAILMLAQGLRGVEGEGRPLTAHSHIRFALRGRYSARRKPIARREPADNDCRVRALWTGWRL